jgi:hypothetical protein
MATFVSKSGESIFVFVQWKNNNVLVKKMQMLQENTRMMANFSFNLDNMMYFVDKLAFSNFDQQLMFLTGFTI